MKRRRTEISSKILRRAAVNALPLLLVLAILQSLWLGYSSFIQPRLEVDRLPERVTDLRGQALPDLSSLVSAGTSSLDSELGMPLTLVVFLLTSCPACEEALPMLEQLVTKHSGSLGFVAIFGESAAELGVMAMQPQFVDQERTVFAAVGSHFVPMILLVQNGHVVHQAVGWSAAVEKRLAAAIGRRI